MDTKITPLPWREGVRGPNNMPVIGAKGLMIAHVCTGIDFQEQADANAAFIVKAVNMHGQLVAALDMLLDDIEEHRGIAYTTFDAEDFARGTLAEAEGK